MPAASAVAGIGSRTTRARRLHSSTGQYGRRERSLPLALAGAGRGAAAIARWLVVCLFVAYAYTPTMFGGYRNALVAEGLPVSSMRRRRVSVSGDTLDGPFPPKPPKMRWATQKRLRAVDAAL